MNQLLKIQGELKAPKNQFNSFGKYKYRSCEDILEALKPLLTKYSCTLTLSDEIKQVGNLTYIEASATLCHEGDCVTVTAQAGIDINRKGMDIAQSCGSSSSYARKYCLQGMFLLDDSASGDPDATNTHGKVTELDKEELIKLTNKLPEDKRPLAVKAIKEAKDEATINTIKNKLNQYA
jgi:hypothetical protein